VLNCPSLGLTPCVRCQFFITTAPADFLDGKHVVFGKVMETTDDMLVLRKIENVPTGPNNRPKLAVKIVGAFQVSLPGRIGLSLTEYHRVR
jgi:hypothetical protein